MADITQHFTTYSRNNTIGKIFESVGRNSIVVHLNGCKVYIMRATKSPTNEMPAAMRVDKSVQMAHGGNLYQLLKAVLERAETEKKDYIVSSLSEVNRLYNKDKQTVGALKQLGDGT